MGYFKQTNPYDTDHEYVYRTRDDGYGNPVVVKEKNHMYVPKRGK